MLSLELLIQQFEASYSTSSVYPSSEELIGHKNMLLLLEIHIFAAGLLISCKIKDF